MPKQKTQRGGGNLDEQIDRIKEGMTAAQIKQAEGIVNDHDPNQIRLAFKLLPKGSGDNRGLGKKVEAMLAKADPTMAKRLRTQLTALQD